MNYRIADLSVNMQVGGRTLKQSEPFLVSETDDPNADINMFDIAERVVYAMEHTVSPKSDPDVVEYVVSGSRFYRLLVNFDGFMLHSSAVVLDDKAYLFSADSGVGKSTHTKLWKERFENAYILNDDKPALRIFEDEIYVYGTPWNGKSSESVNKKVKLGGICFLYRNDKNVIRKLTSSEALQRMIRQTAQRKFKRHTFEKLMGHWDKLLQQCPIYEMGCLPDTEAVELAYQTMKGES